MAVVHVPQDQAAGPIKALLKAAEELGLPASVVATSTDGLYGFSLIVPDEVHAKAFPTETTQEELEPEPEAPAPKKKGGRPKKATAEPVVEEEE